MNSFPYPTPVHVPPSLLRDPLWLGAAVAALALHLVMFSLSGHRPTRPPESTIQLQWLAPPEASVAPVAPPEAPSAPPPGVARSPVTPQPTLTTAATARPDSLYADATPQQTHAALHAASDTAPATPALSADARDPAPLANPQPDYPPLSRRLREQGEVLLRVWVGIDGDVESVALETSSGFPRLDAAALEAVKNWRFSPARRGQDAIAAAVLVPVQFIYHRNS